MILNRVPQPIQSRRRYNALAAGAAALVVASVLVLVVRSPIGSEEVGEGVSGKAAVRSVRSARAECDVGREADGKVAARAQAHPRWNLSVPDSSAMLEACHRRLRDGLSAEEARALLSEAAQFLADLPKIEAVRGLRAALDAGSDARTGLSFAVGAGGLLSEATSWRVWLLDQFGRFDPAAAAAYSARVFARAESPDEWAVALRNEWNGSEATDRIESVRRRALEALDRKDWRLDPSEGFLETCDFLVATVSWEALPLFESWLGAAERPVLVRAAVMALDRLALEAPEDFLGLLAQRSQILDTYPAIRASLFARADPASPGQRAAVEGYLLRPGLAEEEGQRFFAAFPQVSTDLSHNLATPPRFISPQRAAQLDRDALAVVQRWKQAPAFSRWVPDLSAAAARLSEHVASAKRGGLLPP